jgi:hypothetical protein
MILRSIGVMGKWRQVFLQCCVLPFWVLSLAGQLSSDYRDREFLTYIQWYLAHTCTLESSTSFLWDDCYSYVAFPSCPGYYYYTETTVAACMRAGSREHWLTMNLTVCSLIVHTMELRVSLGGQAKIVPVWWHGIKYAVADSFCCSSLLVQKKEPNTIPIVRLRHRKVKGKSNSWKRPCVVLDEEDPVPIP